MQKRRDITFITFIGLPELDADDRLAFDILLKRGLKCGIAVWNDQAIDWNYCGLCVLRSTWDYHQHTELFLQWVQQNPERLVNSADLILWNSNKRYMLNLQQQGVKIVPTEVLPAGSNESLEHLLRHKQWHDVVIKPAVGLATSGVAKFSVPHDLHEAQEHLQALSKKCDVLIQEYMPSINDRGERALIFIDGKYSHAIRKAPFQRLAVAGRAGETSVTANKHEIEFAENVLSKLKETPVYARVDIVNDAQGVTLLMELELIEPSLFLAFDKAAAERFANAIERKLTAASCPQSNA